MFKYFNNVWHIKSQKARPSHLLGPRAEGFALYLVSVHMTHIVYIIQVSVRTLIKIARFAIFSRQIIFLDHICCTYDLKASLYENLHSSDVFLSRQKFHIYLHFVFNTWDLPVYLKNTWQIILSARFVGVLRWPPPRRNKLGPRDSMSP